MIKIWTLKQTLLNGTVFICTDTTNFISREVAEKAMEKLKNLEQPTPFKIVYDIVETWLYEDENEVPILKEKT